MLRIVTDGAADFPPGWLERYRVAVIPINIQMKGRTYLQGVDVNDDDFYRFVEQERVIPKTSQPSPQQFVAFYRRIAQPGDTVLSIHVTSRLSGTFHSAVQAAKELVDEMKVVPFDSLGGSASLAFMCRDARAMAEAGATLEQILARLTWLREHISVVLTLNSLEYARLSGRVRAAQALAAGLLRIKPVVELRDGFLDMVDKVRTRSRSLEAVVQRVKAGVGFRPAHVAVVNARAPQAAQWLHERVQQVLKVRELITTNLSIAVAANLGPGTAGVVAYPAEE
ncbi:MAG TPA: DegV family protein [Anaerolineae bacterium]|nr:DegV family protein [Anaerolineae bacterium]HID85092.1 DegV family protein [Anaerolineales bacterium]